MQAEALCSSLDDIHKKFYIEHCSFSWKIRDFLAESKKSSDYLGTIMFSVGGNDKSIAMWQLDLKMSENDEIVIDLKRMSSQDEAHSFIRFYWHVVDVEGNKVFPGSIHAFAHPGDGFEKVFVPNSSILVKERFYADGCLTVLCELTVYGRTLEDRISSTIRSEVPYQLCVLSEDVEKLFLHESDQDLCITSKDGVMHCHKSILSARSSVFADLLKAKGSEDCELDLGEMNSDTLHAILTFLYCGNLDMYLKYAIPKDLYTAAEKFGLSDLQDHLKAVDVYDLAEVGEIEVTWKLPHLSGLLLQPKVELYCPEQNSNFLYDNRWCFKLEFDSSRDYVSVWVIREQEEKSKHTVQLIVMSTESLLPRSKVLCFEEDGIQGIKECISKNRLQNLVPFQDTLELRCTLKILCCTPPDGEPRDLDKLSSAIALFSKTTEASLIKLSNDLLELFDSGEFSDTVVKTSVGEIEYHSYIADARFQISQKSLGVFLLNLHPSLVQPLFRFIYGAELSTRYASRLKRYALHFGLQNIKSKLSDFLAIVPYSLVYESGSEDDDDIDDAEYAMMVAGLNIDEEDDNGIIYEEHAVMAAGLSTDEDDGDICNVEHSIMVAGQNLDENGNFS